MKKNLILLLLLVCSALFAQKEPNFANEGERMEYSAKKLFNAERPKGKIYKKFEGKITVVDTNTITYGKDTLKINRTGYGLMPIFEKGLLYPGIIAYNISGFEEMPSLSDSPKIKRFNYYIQLRGGENLMIYYVELMNNKATAKTNMKTFIKGATVTFISSGLILI